MGNHVGVWVFQNSPRPSAPLTFSRFPFFRSDSSLPNFALQVRLLHPGRLSR